MPHFRYSTASTLPVRAPPDALFDYLDDHRNLSSSHGTAILGHDGFEHEGPRGRARGAGPSARGSASPEAFWASLGRKPDRHRTRAATPEGVDHGRRASALGDRTLLDGFRIVPQSTSSLLTVFICCDLPRAFATRLPGRLLGGIYARWCMRRRTGAAARHFSPSRVKTERSNACGRS